MSPPLFYVLTINSDEPASRKIFDRFIKNNLVNIWLTGHCLHALRQGNWHNFLTFKLGFGGRQRIMDFNITAAVWLGGRFYRLINKLYAGTDRYFLATGI